MKRHLCASDVGSSGEGKEISEDVGEECRTGMYLPISRIQCDRTVLEQIKLSDERELFRMIVSGGYSL